MKLTNSLLCLLALLGSGARPTAQVAARPTAQVDARPTAQVDAHPTAQVAAQAIAAPAGEILTLEEVAGRGKERIRLSPRSPSWRWAPDGVHLIRGRGDQATWVDPTTGEDVEAKEVEESEEEAPEDPSRRTRRWKLPKGAELRAPAPDGSRVAFVLEGDLYVLDEDGGEARALTSDGGPGRLNGKLDWVYQEEVYGRGRFRAFWWSPDSSRIAFLSLDVDAIPDFTVIDHVTPEVARVIPEITPYPKAGDPNPRTRLGVADVSAGEVRWVDLDAYSEEQPLVVNVGWSPDNQHLLFVLQNRIQSWARLGACDPATGEWDTWIHEQSQSWVERPGLPLWLVDGTFLWTSDRSGFRHFYRYAASGELLGPLTQGDWSVRGLVELDAEAGLLWFRATKDGAVNDNLYRIALDGSGFTRLTQGDGHHRVSFNPDKSLFLDTVSSLATPPTVRLSDGDGKVLHTLGESEDPGSGRYALGSWELVEIPTPDGVLLDGAVLKPPSLDPEKAYPIWISTYSGPDAPSVRNRWRADPWLHFLAQHGLIVLQVNVRTASGRGQRLTELCYGRLGEIELRDLESALDWLCANPWADGSRVGIIGSSYGGFMAAYALTHSDRFALGIAESGVYDWRLYDSIYAERYMGLPQDNAEGYAASSVVEAAADLEGHLLLTHGTMDDNVHVQNAFQLAYALQKADRPFDMMLYPESRHGFSDGDLRWHRLQLVWKTIQEHLQPVTPE